MHGNLSEGAIVDDALDGVDRVVHLGALVGVGQSMYEIERYVRDNTFATAVFLERLVAREPRPTRLVVASSMSIYGEGEYACAEHGRVAPHPRPEEQLLARDWECVCPRCGRELTPVATSEKKPLIPTSVYAITKRDHEELCLVVGGAYGIPTVALRFFNVYGPGQALSNPYTGVAAIFASRLLNGKAPLVFEDGCSRATSSTSTTSSAGSCWRWSRTTPSARRSISARAVRARSTTSRRSLAEGLGLDIAGESPASIGRATSATATQTPSGEALLGFRAIDHARGRHA